MSEKIKIDLGGFLKVAGYNKKMTDTKIAEKAGMSKTSYSILKSKGTCNMNTLKRILTAMNEPLVIQFNGTNYEITDKN